MGKLGETIGIVIGTLFVLSIGTLMFLGMMQERTQKQEEEKIIASFTGGMEVIGICEGHNNRENKQDTFTYYRETTTDVMYICYEEYRKGSLNVMMDPETGLPLTYSRYMELTEKDKEN